MMRRIMMVAVIAPMLLTLHARADDQPAREYRIVFHEGTWGLPNVQPYWGPFREVVDFLQEKASEDQPAKQVFLRYGGIRLSADQSTVLKLSELIREYEGIPLEERRRRHEEVSAETDKLNAGMDLIMTLHWAARELPTSLADRVKHLREEQQRLQDQMSDRKARVDTLNQAIDQHRQRLEKQREADPIFQQLLQMEKVQQQKIQHVEQLRAVGRLESSEHLDAQAALAEVRIRIAQREIELSKSGRGDLLDRLTSELAIAMVDLTELELRLEPIIRELKRYDVKEIDEAQLEKLLAQDAAQRDAPVELPPLYHELDRRRKELYLEIFRLGIKEIVPVTPSDP